MKPQNFEEKVVWYTMIGTYGLYFLGAQFPWISAMSWFLTIYLCKKLWNQPENTPNEERIFIPSGIWVWILSMLVMAVALVVGHLDFKLGNFQLIASLVEFTRSWALLALIPLIGCLNIRPQLIYRAACIICLHSLIAIAISFVAIKLNFTISYLSPLQLIGKGGRTYYRVLIGAGGYDPMAAGDELRMQLFTPWAPALGLAGNVYFFLAREESNIKWRWIGMIGAVAMVWVSVSRAGLVCLPAVALITWILTVIFNKPKYQIAFGIGSFFSGIVAPVVIDFFNSARDSFTNARAGSSRVRKVLKEIELYRWKEAPIWGHGISEYPGPKVTEHMPIGSHDTWIALLYVRGAVGCAALAFPMLWSFVTLLIKAQSSTTARAGLSIVLVLCIFGFSEGIEILAYTYWPGLLMMGIALKEKVPYQMKATEEYALL
ncbi:O-antigen ligase domain-containing protein [Coleofasciculus sp. FACHB-1120]|uniref:O-antigen ligase family protein n=1 Tax=Coleofasciculus sp. FACHB-1120 TaxID=2692783 RepID=UPI0016891603|nr:O-antigen ligase domain-containing protein [Coleofasciculus sp. FACHB-1120]MBD2740775.1 O-antigen ligase domain-containing protein [Coleofasciculus sp. FACHB-1120]